MALAPMDDDAALNASAAPPPAGLDEQGRKETELERYDRNLTELMGELRVALPGVQVLFAFLLVAPFNQRFGRVSMFERDVYFATLLLTLLASILLIAPTVIHRLEFRRGRKAYIVETSSRMALAGLTTFAIAMTSAIFLITHYLLGPATAIVTAAVAVSAFALTWFVMPLRHRARGR
jgi:hypothetical protein